MRIDKFLKNSRLIKRRTIAKKACDDGNVFINGKEAKPADDVTVGDRITIEFGESTVNVEVVEVKSHVRKNQADQLYKYI
jgi:ribosomal 50S subunit-recycling heat shock protein